MARNRPFQGAARIASAASQGWLEFSVGRDLDRFAKEVIPALHNTKTTAAAAE